MIAAIKRMAADARVWQQDMLLSLSALDDACREHMAHGAMTGNDPLIDSMLDQADAAAACAAKGAQPPVPYTAGQQPQAEPRGWWLVGITMLAALVSVALFAPGVAS